MTNAYLHHRVNTANLRRSLSETFDENGNVSMSKAEAFLFGMRAVLPILLDEIDALRVIGADYAELCAANDRASKLVEVMRKDLVGGYMANQNWVDAWAERLQAAITASQDNPDAPIPYELTDLGRALVGAK